jgi:hypothetical protein
VCPFVPRHGYLPTVYSLNNGQAYVLAFCFFCTLLTGHVQAFLGHGSRKGTRAIARGRDNSGNSSCRYGNLGTLTIFLLGAEV